MPMAFVQLPPLPSASAHNPGARSRVAPIAEPEPGPIFTKTGFLAIGSFSLAERVSRFEDRVLRAMLLPPVSRSVPECPGRRGG